MKNITLFIVIFILAGCSSVKPIDSKPENLHEVIKEGTALQVGDTVEIVTVNADEYSFKITKIDEKKIYGAKDEVLISDIVTLKSREFSWVKTALLTGTVGILVWALIIASVIASTVAL